MMVQAFKCREYKGKNGKDNSSQACLPDACPLDKILWTGQHTSSHSSQPFIERDVDRISKRRDLSAGSTIKRSTFPETRAIEMERYSLFASPGGERRQFFPRQQFVACPSQGQ